MHSGRWSNSAFYKISKPFACLFTSHELATNLNWRLASKNEVLSASMAVDAADIAKREVINTLPALMSSTRARSNAGSARLLADYAKPKRSIIWTHWRAILSI